MSPLSTRLCKLIAFVLTFTLVSTSAQAGIVSVTAGSAEIVVPPAGTNLNDDQYRSNLVRAFNEQAQVTVSNLQVDTLVSLLAPGSFTLAGYGPVGTPGSISGTFQSHLLHFDPRNDGPTIDQITSGPFAAADGAVTFDAPIVALIFSQSRLDATDAIFGLSGILYPSGSGGNARDLEQHNAQSDRIWLSADRQTLFYNWQVPGALDQVRVITAIPEPSALILAGLGLAGLACGQRYRRRSKRSDG